MYKRQPQLPATPLRERLTRPIAEWQSTVGNDFEPSVFAAHPELAAVKAALLDAGARYAAMSGSGSTLFGLFDDEAAARRIATPFRYPL